MLSNFKQVPVKQVPARHVLARGLVAGLALGLLGFAPKLALTIAGPDLIWVPSAEAGKAAGVDAASVDAAGVDAAQVVSLGDVMQLGPLLAVIREEGLAYGDGLDQALLDGAGGLDWRAEVARIYDPVKARTHLDTALLAALSTDPATVRTMLDFFASPLGIKVTGLEVQARRSFLDPAAKDPATVAWLETDEKSSPRAATLHRLIDALGLIDLNVQGTLNANLALYRGLALGGGLKSPMGDEDALAHVAGEERRARTAAQVWLYPYMALAYKPLADAELDGYVDYLTSDAGKKANMAMFHAFDALFAGISHDLGLAASQRLAGHDI